ncbi:MAG: phosphoenolpyruvate carboxykinase (ATP) [Bacteroidota bacterium]
MRYDAKRQPEEKQNAWLAGMGLEYLGACHWQLPPAALVEEALRNHEGVLSSTGALVCSTGKFTGRSPRDKFIVQDSETHDKVWWGTVNTPFAPQHFEALYQRVVQFLKGKKVYLRDAYASALPAYQLPIRIINTVAWHNLFAHNLFVRPSQEALREFVPEFTIISVPEFQAVPQVDGTRQANFTIINFTKKIILIGGTGYAGEMKKGIFAFMNYMLPQRHQVLPMHCAANMGSQGDTAIFFGLSGTGKTTLSADSGRRLIGDDEHGWYDEGIFNFEGGCYAKTIHLSPEREPQIFQAIKFGAILENQCFVPGTRIVDYDNATVTENTRTAYPIEHVPQAIIPSLGGIPKHIFFLTCDAHGVLPPIAKLNKAQAMYHFLTGYTAKVAGTETDVIEPQATFSACFGASFLPLHPTQYAAMLGQKMEAHEVSVWLVNTGWVGGPYGVGERIALAHTRTIITAALSGALDKVDYATHEIFNIAVPTSCPGIPYTLLSPISTWNNTEAYTQQARQLASNFVDNFKQYENFADAEICAGGPSLS